MAAEFDARVTIESDQAESSDGAPSEVITSREDFTDGGRWMQGRQRLDSVPSSCDRSKLGNFRRLARRSALTPASPGVCAEPGRARVARSRRGANKGRDGALMKTSSEG